MKIGKITGNALKRSVLKPITYKREEVIKGAAIGADCAFFAVPEGFVMTSCVQAGIVADATDLEMLIGRGVNNLAAGGAKPMAVMPGIFLPLTAEEVQLKEVVTKMHEICKAYGMQIAGGHTSVSAAVSQLTMTVTFYGLQKKEYATGNSGFLKGAAPGQDIVLSKWIGLEGTALLAKKHEKSLQTRYPSYLVEEAAGFGRFYSVLPEASVAAENGVCHMHDASEGGILAALWEMAEGAGTGLTIDLKKLPIRQETVEVCEHVGINPYELRSGGCLIMTSEDGEQLVRALEEAGIPAVMVGKLTDSRERLILNEDEVRYMDRPKVDEIYKDDSKAED